MSVCLKCGKIHTTPQTIFGQSDLCRTCLWKLNPELKIDPHGPGFLPLTDREQQEAMIKKWRDPNYEHYDPDHADEEEAAMNAKYDPNYPTDPISLTPEMAGRRFEKAFGSVRTHIPCINWFDNNPFDFLKPKPTKKATKPKKPKKQPIPYDQPNKPQKTPWDVDPWNNPKDPWKRKNPYDYKKWKEEYE